MYDKWSKGGYEDFILIQSEKEDLYNNQDIKDVLIKDKSEIEYNQLFNNSEIKDDNSTFNKFIT